jgi:hypothetical protein
VLQIFESTLMLTNSLIKDPNIYIHLSDIARIRRCSYMKETCVGMKRTERSANVTRLNNKYVQDNGNVLFGDLLNG